MTRINETRWIRGGDSGGRRICESVVFHSYGVEQRAAVILIVFVFAVALVHSAEVDAAHIWSDRDISARVFYSTNFRRVYIIDRFVNTGCFGVGDATGLVSFDRRIWIRDLVGRKSLPGRNEKRTLDR